MEGTRAEKRGGMVLLTARLLPEDVAALEEFGSSLGLPPSVLVRHAVNIFVKGISEPEMRELIGKYIQFIEGGGAADAGQEHLADHARGRAGRTGRRRSQP